MKELKKKKNQSSVGNGIVLILTLGFVLGCVFGAIGIAFMNALNN